MKCCRIPWAIVSLVMIFGYSSAVYAGDLDRGYSLQSSGQLEDAAEFFCRYSVSNPSNRKNTPEALLRCARLLDTLTDALSERAEKACYWGRKGDPDCMRQHAARYNARFGPGSFRYEHAVLYIPYTGVHYRTIKTRFSGSKYAPEADFYLLLRDLIGHPDNVLPKVKAYLSRYKKGEWNRKGLLLWARVNEDVWYVHRKWSWVLFNYQIAPEELMVRAEPYRQEALRSYKKIIKDDPGSFEGRAAKREYEVLNANRDDGVAYSIVNDSSGGTLDMWGIAVPSARQTVTAPGGAVQSGSPTNVYVPPPSAPPAEPVIDKKKSTPQRWGN